MKFSTSAKDLLDALTTASRVASTRSAIQALGGVQITATKKSGVHICATDMDIGLRLPLEGAVATDGTVVLPARLLLDVAKSLQGMDASLELRPVEQDVEVLSGSASFHVRTLRAEDFPPLPEPAADNAVNVPATAFVDTINRVARAASRDETRPVLTGVYVSASGSTLLMVATDSYRLSLKETVLEAPLVGELEAVIPAHAPAGARQDRGPRRRARDPAGVAARQPGRLRGRRCRAVLPADRRAVPQLQAAAARQLRA